jgi:hypothetical protein
MDRDESFDAFNLVWYAPSITNLEPLPRNRVFSGINAGYLRNNWDVQSVSLAFKGGFNLADHAHLDLGTFVLDYAGIRWISDLGRDDYDLPEYFDRTVGGGRWHYFRLNTKSHNTLLINQQNQVEDAHAVIVQHDLEAENPFAVLDLSEAYAPHTKSVFRTYKLLDNGLMIIDKVHRKESMESIQWQLLTNTEVQVSGNSATISAEGKQMQVTLIQPSNAVFEVVSAKPAEPEMDNAGYKLLKTTVTNFDEPVCEIIVKIKA